VLSPMPTQTRPGRRRRPTNHRRAAVAAFAASSVVAAGLGVSFAVASPASAASVRYVATNGSDSSGNGSAARPFATINRAMAVARPGDVVNVRGGTYSPVTATWIGVSGTPKARIVLRSHPGERAVIDAARLPFGSDGIATGGSYLDIVGFEVRNASRIGINVWGGHHIRIQNNIVHGNRDAGIFMGYHTRGTVTDILVSGNDVYDNARVNSERQGPHPGIILAMKASRVTVTRNHVHQNYGEGIDFVMTDHGVATYNRVWDNYAAEMYMDNATHSTFSHNLVYTTGDKRFFWMGAPPSGIHLANEYYDIANPLDHNTITNNIVIGGHWGLYYGSYQRGGGLRNTLIAHNTFYKGTGEVLHIDADAGHRATVIRNNIFRQSGKAPLVSVARTAGITYSHNAWSGGKGVTGRGDVRSDPRLVAAGKLTAASYRLRAGSPAINRAAPLAAVTRDYFGTSRGSRPDIGAAEFAPPRVVAPR